MQIPKAFDLGRNTWTVNLTKALSRCALGRVTYKMHWVQVVTHRLGRRRRPRDIAHSFWHETTHAILHDMGHPLRDDEFFVDAFAKRLNQIVHTAKL